MAGFPMQMTFDGKDGNSATARTAGGRTFPLPASLVPAQCAPGDSFCLDLGAVEAATMPDADRALLAKAVLNELLRTS